eukprot:g11452.t1
MLDGLRGCVVTSLRQEVGAVANMNALLMKQMLEHAEQQGATLTFDTSSVEDQALLEEVERMRVDGKLKRNNGQASRLVSIKDEHARLVEESQAMQAKNDVLEAMSEKRLNESPQFQQLKKLVSSKSQQVMEWEEFTGFVIDQVLALTREAPRADRLKVRSLGARDKPSVSRSSVRRVRYEKHLGCVFSCTGPVVEVWDPAMRADVAESLVDGSTRQRSGGGSSAAADSAKGFFAYAPYEAARGFEMGVSAALPCPEDDHDHDGGSKGYGGSRRSLHGANPNKSRDGAPVNVVALDVKYIKASNLLMVLRSDLTLAFFLADSNFVRVGLAKTAFQQYVLEHCAVTGLAFTSGCDGTIQSFAIDSCNSGDGDQQQHVLVTATPVGVLRRHTDVVQDLLTVNGSEAEGGQRLVSCGLDRRVCVWDIAKGTFAQSKHGNRAAIRSLAFDPGDNLLLGAGVEGEVLVWDMFARLGAPLFRMQGHRTPVLSVACAPGKGRASSLDDTGKMILWDTRRNASVDNNERYLCQVDCSSNRPSSLDIVSDDSTDYFRFLQGARIRILSPGHDGPVSGMVYIKEDKVIVTGGWDRSLRVYDEVPREGDPPLLRKVEGAHSSDINVVAVSQRLSLIASGSAGGTCKLWDFQLLYCEGTCSVGNEVLCLCFLEPYPLVAVGDAGGYVSIFPVRPWVEGGGGGRCDALLRFANDQQAEGTIEGPAAVTCLTCFTHTVRRSLAGGNDAGAACVEVHVDASAGVGGDAATAATGVGGGDRGGGMERMVVYTGDDNGTVRAWEVGMLDTLASPSGLGYHAVREEDLPRSRSNYDPRRRFYKQADAPTPPQDANTGAVEVPESSKALMENLDPGVSAATGILEDSDGVPRKRGSNLKAQHGLGGELDERGGPQPKTTSIAFAEGVTLAGEWTPHSEAVVSLEVLQDPPSLLTASRDRSVKLRALPTTSINRAATEKVGPMSQDPDPLPTPNDNDEDGDEADQDSVTHRDPPRPPPAKPEDQGPVSGTDGASQEPRAGGGSSGAVDVPGGCPPSSTGTVGSLACSLTSSRTTTSATPPPHGHDLATLTLGRIADACRRDTYSFPVDLKGRGEGRAVEARAVLQAIEEIEVRKERRKKEQAALNRARDGAAAAAAAAAAEAAAAATRATSMAAATIIPFDRLPGQQEPSLLDYSHELQGQVGPVLGTGSWLPPGNECHSGGMAFRTGEATLLAADVTPATTGEAPCAEEGPLTSINGEGTDVKGERGGGDRAREERGCDTHPAHVEVAPWRQLANGDPDDTRRTAEDNRTAEGITFAGHSGAEDDASEAPMSVADPRRSHPAAVGEDRGARRGAGAGAGEGGPVPGIDINESLLDAVTAKVKTRHTPRRRLPAYLSASPDGFGAASRWGALSKAHLEFHRLGTAGLLSSLSCPSLKQHLDGISNCKRGASCSIVRAARAPGMTRLRASCRGRQEALPPCGTPLTPADLDVLAQKHEQAQAEWKRRLEDFTAFAAGSGASTPGQGGSGGASRKPSLRKVRKGTRLQKVSRKQQHQCLGGAPRERSVGKTSRTGAKRGWSLLPKEEQGHAGEPRREGGGGGGRGETNDARRKEVLRAMTRFGPYSRRELFALWRAFDLAKAFESRVDARLLYKNPFLRDHARYRRLLMEVLSATARTGPVLLTREDALLKLLPLLERSDAKTFILAAKLAETDHLNSGTGNTDDYADDGEGQEIETDPETLRELRALFDLYDVDRSGLVDVKEIVVALKGNYSTDQISAGMGDAVTEAELAVLISSLSSGTAGGGTTTGSGTAASKREDTAGEPEVDFHDFVRLFRGVF